MSPKNAENPPAWCAGGLPNGDLAWRRIVCENTIIQRLGQAPTLSGGPRP